MAKFSKLNQTLDRMHDRLDILEAQGVDITKLAKGGRNLVAEGLRREAANLEKNRAAAVAHAAATFAVGDVVSTRRGERGQITAISGSHLILNIGGVSRTFSASLVRPA